MTRKHFAAIAEAIAEAHRSWIARTSPAGSAAIDLVAEHIATKLAPFNPAFDRARFLRACRVER